MHKLYIDHANGDDMISASKRNMKLRKKNTNKYCID